MTMYDIINLDYTLLPQPTHSWLWQAVYNMEDIHLLVMVT